jgi:poly(A)-specific ribonuclease
MDVDASQFRKCLLPILRDICQAKIVTFDLEMSGISTKPKSGAGERTFNIGKPTLQQQYEEMKYAAETYQVLQMGITCVSEDCEKGMAHLCIDNIIPGT